MAPDLTHIASRQILPRILIRTTMRIWRLDHSCAVAEAGGPMPDLTQFNGQQLRDLVAYLRQLK